MAQNSDKKLLYGYWENLEYQSLEKKIPRHTNSNDMVIKVDSLKSATSINGHI